MADIFHLPFHCQLQIIIILIVFRPDPSKQWDITLIFSFLDYVSHAKSSVKVTLRSEWLDDSLLIIVSSFLLSSLIPGVISLVTWMLLLLLYRRLPSRWHWMTSKQLTLRMFPPSGDYKRLTTQIQSDCTAQCPYLINKHGRQSYLFIGILIRCKLAFVIV